MTRSSHPSAEAGTSAKKQSTDVTRSLPPDFFNPPKFAGALKTGARQLIEDHGQFEKLGFDPKKDDLASLGKRLHVTTKISYYETLALAYAFWIRSSENDTYRRWVQEYSYKRFKTRRHDRRVTPLHLIVEAFIVYGDDSNGSYSKKRGLYNRDVQAILWLHKQHVRPDQLEDYRKSHPEGSDGWCRNMASASGRIKRIVNKVEAKPNVPEILRTPQNSTILISIKYKSKPSKAIHTFIESIKRDLASLQAQGDVAITVEESEE